MIELRCPYCGAVVLAGAESAVADDESETGYYHRHNAQMVALERGEVPRFEPLADEEM